jgi:hypothetical protein
MKLLKILTASVLSLIASTSMALTISKATDTDVNIIFQELDPGLFELYMFDQETGFTNPLLARVGEVIEITGTTGNDFFPTGYSNLGLLEFFPFNATLVEGVTPVPVPASVWLLGSGLIGMVAVARRRV